MPVIALAKLIAHEPLRAVAARLPSVPRGVFLSTGQASSGKVTILTSLADFLAGSMQPVCLLSDRTDEFKVFSPRPPTWREVIVEPTEEAWSTALATSDPDELIVVSPLSRANAGAVFATGMHRRILAALDTALVGPDVAHTLREMGVEGQQFADAVGCVSSQFLVDALCRSCAVEVATDSPELSSLFPGGQRFDRLWKETGCPECNGRGIKGKIAVTELLVVDDSNRRALGEAVDEGAALAPDPASYLTIQQSARALLAEGSIGLRVYRDAIRRNPLLRAQNLLEREQAHSYRLGNVFEKFVSPEVKRRLLESPTLDSVIKGEARDITCLFCDIRGFTARAESRDPEELFTELNLYFAEVVDAVLQNDGTIDKFIGDAVMVVFGAPVDQPDHARRALDCALAIRSRVENFNVVRSADLPIEVGMGINSGRAVAGCLGTDKRMEYTVLGDTVNVAARLESRAQPGQILISRATQALAGAGWHFDDAGILELKGKAQSIHAFSLVGKAVVASHGSLRGSSEVAPGAR
jgi:class 3 adenylate cyclase